MYGKLSLEKSKERNNFWLEALTKYTVPGSVKIDVSPEGLIIHDEYAEISPEELESLRSLKIKI